MSDARTISDFAASLPNGQQVSLADKAGKVLLVVNTASKCGFTPQYSGLETLWENYRDRGFEVIAFPCNQFGGQEPGNGLDIAGFCAANYGVSFPLMAKVDVNGPKALALYKWMKEQAPGILGSRRIKWNFTKFLIGRDGRVARRYSPMTIPEDIAKDIEALL